MTSARTPRDAAVRSIMIMADGELDDFEEVIAPGALNREAGNEPPDCRIGGPAGFHASALWLRAAFEHLTWDVQHVAADSDLVVIDTSMSGRHVGDFVLYDIDGNIERAYAPTGKTFTVKQTHWLRLQGQQVGEHWAVRDDLGQGLQLGWVPPTPLYLIRCAQAARRARRASAST